MNSAVRIIGLLISFVLLITGFIDILQQYKSGLEINWNAPIILLLFGFGVGLPIILWLPSFGENHENNRPHSDDSSDGSGGDGD